MSFKRCNHVKFHPIVVLYLLFKLNSKTFYVIYVFNGSRHRSHMYTFARVVSIWREIHKSESDQKIFSKLCTFVIMGYSDALYVNKVNEKKLRVRLPCLGYNTGKRNIPIHIYWCLQKSSWTKKVIGSQFVIAAKPVPWVLSYG